MHLLCRDPDCVGNDLPAGKLEDASCRYCGALLESEDGNVLAQGAAPVVDGQLPIGFNALMDAMREGGQEVYVVELVAVTHGEHLLVSAVDDDGNLLAAELHSGERAAEVAGVLDLLT